VIPKSHLFAVIVSEGTNVEIGFDYYVNLYIETHTSSSPKSGASVKKHEAKKVGTVSTQAGTTKLGAHVSEYRPELVAAMGEAL
jgi:hypothetical protein